MGDVKCLTCGDSEYSSTFLEMNRLKDVFVSGVLGGLAGVGLAATSFVAIEVLMPRTAAASMQQSINLIYKGNGAMDTATHSVKTTGTQTAACPHLKIAADSYASAYVLYQDQRTLNLMKQAHGQHEKYC